MRLTRLTASLAAAAAAVTLGGPVMAQDLREFSFGLPSRSLVASAPRIADDMGLFEKHGLKPDFTFIDTTAGIASALLSRSVEIGETDTPAVIAAASRGQELLILANHYNGLAGSLVLSNAVVERLGVAPDAPVAERLAALDGVLLATTSAVSTLTISYKGAANANGAEPEFAYMAISAMAAALETGAVEGAVITAPGWAYPVLNESAVLWISPPNGDLPAVHMPRSAAVTATTPAYAEANPEIVQGVAAVFDDLAAAFTERPDEVKASISRLFPDMDAETLDLIFSMESKAFDAAILTPEDIAHDIEYMKTSGTDFGPIDQVDPASVLYQRP